MKHTVIGLLSFLCAFFFGQSIQAAEPPTRPNIIVILTDDMGYSDLGCYGGEIQTPTLDNLAAGGIRFTQFYNTARCCPTRASLLTGLHPHQAGIGHMTDDRKLPGFTGDLLPSCVTIAEALKTSGYATYALGKWHVTKFSTDSDKRDNWPTRRGFDHYYGLISGATNYFEPATLLRNETPISPMNDPQYKPDEYYLTTAISDNAVRYLNEHARSKTEKPFFMYVAFTAAHWPMQARPQDIAKYEGRYDQGYDPIRQARFERMRSMGLLDPRWELTPKTNEWDRVQNKAWESKCMEVFAAMVDSMDQGVGSIVSALKENGQYEDTVIFYLQDNGACAEGVGRQSRQDYPERVDKPVYEPYPPEKILHRREEDRRTRDGFPVITGEKVMPGPRDTFIAYGQGWANVSNTPFREFKHWIHEGGISTPLIVHAPSLISESMKGRFYNEYGQLVDIMATCLDLAGAGYPENRDGVSVTPLQGTSLKPALTGKTLDRKKPLFWEHEGNRAIRDGKWKLVAKGPSAPWELYDMEVDRSEMNNVAGDHPEIAGKMVSQWENWANKSNVFPWPWGKYQRKFRTKIDENVEPDALIFEMRFENGPLKDSSGVANSFTIDGSPLGVFDGKTWITIEKSDAFECGDAPWRVEAEIIAEAPDGVIMSQGGLNHGYSLYLKDGKPAFAVRIGGEIHSVTGEYRIEGNTTLSGTLTSKKQLVLQVNGKTVAQKNVPDLIYDTPVDPPIVGNDLSGKVSGLDLPAFKGKMKRIAVYRGGWTF
ncbi:MAG: sulfatase-like hydrolase/transferase [Planctomycetaceae bacterium]|nr:sulfatase-like hydrolase/transferase [Planctomycetaceae bacterium]